MNALGMGRILDGLIKLALKSPLERERDLHSRQRELSAGIDESPNDMTRYVLRGELYLERREHELALADFERAVELAERLDDAKGWNIVEQVMRDRALYGLKVARGELR
ncbi:MAG: hypothetical protein OXG85_00785 [Chloroflexi bacterium]|nr:hypothetical protein [Chloroflexota bacterium]